MPTFQCLNLLENPDLLLIELNWLGMPAANAPLPEGSTWLRLDRQTMQVTQLHLSSKDSSGAIEERYFDQGYLKFSASSGTFIEKYNSAQHPLTRTDCKAIPEDLEMAIGQYFSETSPG